VALGRLVLFGSRQRIGRAAAVNASLAIEAAADVCGLLTNAISRRDGTAAALRTFGRLGSIAPLSNMRQIGDPERLCYVIVGGRVFARTAAASETNTACAASAAGRPSHDAAAFFLAGRCLAVVVVVVVATGVGIAVAAVVRIAVSVAAVVGIVVAISVAGITAVTIIVIVAADI
jgi:hypothetical protein